MPFRGEADIRASAAKAHYVRKPAIHPHRTLASPGLNQIIRASHPNVPCPPERGHAPDLQPEDHRPPRCEGSRFRKAPPSGGCQAPGVRPPWRARCTQSQTDMTGPNVKQRAAPRPRDLNRSQLWDTGPLACGSTPVATPGGRGDAPRRWARSRRKIQR